MVKTLACDCFDCVVLVLDFLPQLKTNLNVALILLDICVDSEFWCSSGLYGRLLHCSFLISLSVLARISVFFFSFSFSSLFSISICAKFHGIHKVVAQFSIAIYSSKLSIPNTFHLNSNEKSFSIEIVDLLLVVSNFISFFLCVVRLWQFSVHVHSIHLVRINKITLLLKSV